MKQKPNYRLYLVTDAEICPRENLLDVCEKAIDGGVSIIQLREKDISSREFYNEAAALKTLCTAKNVPLIINDRLDIALAVDADGIHIGQSDMPLAAARRILGSGKIIGVSAGNVSEALDAEHGGADYLGVGAVFPTGTKKDAENIGIDMLKQVTAAASIPIVGIGGINHENINLLRGSGIDGVAVVSCIMGSKDPYSAAETLREKTELL